MRRKHKNGVVSSVYDYIFLLPPSSSDPRATILLVSDGRCLTMYKRACYFRPVLKLACIQHYLHDKHVYTSTTRANSRIITKEVQSVCIYVWVQSPGYLLWVMWSLYSVKGYDSLWHPPYICKTIKCSVKDCFLINQVSDYSVWYRMGACQLCSTSINDRLMSSARIQRVLMFSNLV